MRSVGTEATFHLCHPQHGGMLMPKPELIIDSNERGLLCESVERKAEKAGLVVIRQSLVVGDYQLGGALVEAKSINDLFLSSHSGHLWRTGTGR